MTRNLSDLWSRAVDEGELSPDTAQSIDIDDLGAEIERALGVDVDDVGSSEITLVSILIDDSGSIAGAGNEDLVREGHNDTILGALSGSKEREGILVHARYLNRGILYPYSVLEGAVLMDRQNYSAGGTTPLYDQTVTFLTTVMMKAEEFTDAGVPTRTVSLIVTDGEDVGSMSHSAKTVESLVRDMFRQEMHIVAAMGIDNGHTDFREVFREMGIPDEWMLLPRDDRSDIRRAFRLFSQSAQRASQNAGSFSKTKAGGFA